MTKQEIEAVLDRVRTWPHERQEMVATALLDMERDETDIYVLDEAERADIEEGLAEADRGEFASPDDVAALFAKYRS
ncbi:hypothetical protein [uncultured Enterovirga sp.]|uniref:hypothetical protein n=1 Tax=uncultured Enterovirga sp. TaxID=2026352 RepID=UPI0035CBFCE5